MRLVLTYSLAVLTLALGSRMAAGSDHPWTQLSLSTCQVDAFRQANPKIDGQGIVIAVLDTGVDMGVPGLQRTPNGEVKVVDVQDFSTQGDVELSRVVWNEEGDRLVHHTGDGTPQLYVPPVAEHRPLGSSVWFGLLKEEAFKNSSVSDVNDNGRKDDVFAVCMVSLDDGHDDDAVCFVDTDGDRDFSNERPLKSYRLNLDTFTFVRQKKEKEATLLTCAVNLFPRQRKVVFHFDDGGHGTHVAGIAAGCRILNQDGFHGVAPGAKVISLKIGENSLAGGASTTGAMKKAFEYAAKFAREKKVTVVCNLSYGVGSELEGQSDFDRYMEKLLQANPGLIVCTSAGNEGPGLSTVGTPAAAESIIGVAALLAADTARDVLGLKLPHAVVTGFSSRGGELGKPDIATPGMMSSTVPMWTRGRGDFWSGTSMASPYAAGLCALLAQQVREKVGAAPRADWVKRALLDSGEAIPGFTVLDYGAGRPDMVKAAARVEEIARGGVADPLYGFEVSTESPLAPEGIGPAAFWRSTHFPTDRPQSFTVKPVFVPQADADAITGFSKRLTLRCDAAWCELLQDQIHFRAAQSATVRVRFLPDKLTEPGLHVAMVEGREGDAVLLRLFASVIVPHKAVSESGYRVLLENQTAEGWKVQRHFFAVPAGASAMHITMRAVGEQPSNAGIPRICRPDGHEVGHYYAIRLDTRSDRRESSFTVSEDLVQGVWELPVINSKADESSTYSLEVRFDGVQMDPPKITRLSGKAGSKPSGSVGILNVFDRPTTVTVSGKIEGYRKTITKTLKPDDDTATIPIEFTSNIGSVRISVEVSDRTYAKFTDCAVSVFDGSGKAIAKDGLNEPVLTLSVDNPAPEAESASGRLEIRPAFMHHDIDDSAEFEIEVDYLYAEPINIAVTRGGSSSLTLYPGISAELALALEAVLPAIPEGMRSIGYVRATERAAKQPIAETKIHLEK